MLPDQLDQIPGDQPLGIVTADGAYDTRACHAAIAARGAAAVIPPRSNGNPGKNTRQERPRATMPYAVAAAFAGPYGSAGQAITDEV